MAAPVTGGQRAPPASVIGLGGCPDQHPRQRLASPPRVVGPGGRRPGSAWSWAGGLALLCLATPSAPAWAASAPAGASPYKLILLSYENAVLEGAEPLADVAAETLGLFVGLAPPYARLVHAHSRGLPLAWRAEELFPGERLNPLLIREWLRRAAEVLGRLPLSPALLELQQAAAKRGVHLRVFTALDNALVAHDLQARGLKLQLVPIPPASAAQPFPPIAAARAELDLPSGRVLVVGATNHECETAGVLGVDFVAYGELPEAPLRVERPCIVKQRLRSLADLPPLLKPGR